MTRACRSTIASSRRTTSACRRSGRPLRLRAFHGQRGGHPPGVDAVHRGLDPHSGYQCEDRPALELYEPDFTVDPKTGVFSRACCACPCAAGDASRAPRDDDRVAFGAPGPSVVAAVEGEVGEAGAREQVLDLVAVEPAQADASCCRSAVAGSNRNVTSSVCVGQIARVFANRRVSTPSRRRWRPGARPRRAPTSHASFGSKTSNANSAAGRQVPADVRERGELRVDVQQVLEGAERAGHQREPAARRDRTSPSAPRTSSRLGGGFFARSDRQHRRATHRRRRTGSRAPRSAAAPARPARRAPAPGRPPPARARDKTRRRPTGRA